MEMLSHCRRKHKDETNAPYSYKHGCKQHDGAHREREQPYYEHTVVHRPV